MKKIVLILGLALSGNVIAQNTKILLKTDTQGEVVEGSQDTLIEAVRSGSKIRVGWSLDFDKDGKADVEHFIDADFLTVLNGHVFNQTQFIYAQAPNSEKPQVEIGNSEMQWVAVIGSNGILMSRFIVPNADTIENEEYKKQVKMMTQVREEKVPTIWVLE